LLSSVLERQFFAAGSFREGTGRLLVGSCATLRIYFWIDARKNDGMTMKSSLLRLVKKTLQDASISLADPGREVIIPQAVAIQLLDSKELTLSGRQRYSGLQGRARPSTATQQQNLVG
jgi:hypothetical protein